MMRVGTRQLCRRRFISVDGGPQRRALRCLVRHNSQGVPDTTVGCVVGLLTGVGLRRTGGTYAGRAGLATVPLQRHASASGVADSHTERLRKLLNSRHLCSLRPTSFRNPWLTYRGIAGRPPRAGANLPGNLGAIERGKEVGHDTTESSCQAIR